MRLFDTNVQKLKYEVLLSIIRNAYDHDCENIYIDIPKRISPGPRASMRCCIYKERAILQERIKLALGGSAANPNVIEVIDIACDECPSGGISVTDACRGCIVHKCTEVCPKKAVHIIDRKAVIDKSTCIECGKCAKVCPFFAITEHKRPCQTSCKVNAICMDENLKAVVDNDKCIQCGACVYQCPFGAISDKSYVMDVIELLKASCDNTKYKTYAVVAPSIASQFKYATTEQLVSGIKSLGFHGVVEAALGADITLNHELEEWQEKRLLTTSCCPSFVAYVEKNFPKLAHLISHSVSPMVETAMLIKRVHADSKVVFIGPCVSKKDEFKLDKTEGAIDSVLSFEELQAFFDARYIDVSKLAESPLDNASYYGRIFAKSGGITEGLTALAAERGIEGLKPIAMNGLEECRINLLKLAANRSEYNFFEGMACVGGCAGGALCLNHADRNTIEIDKHAAKAKEKSPTSAMDLYNQTKNQK